MVLRHLFFQQTLRIRNENLVETQATRAQFRGSSSSLKKMLRTTSSESFENIVSCILRLFVRKMRWVFFFSIFFRYSYEFRLSEMGLRESDMREIGTRESGGDDIY
ncbi:hypothetical protein PanWU01x14_114090 [Parasponia andersonii]|uniref:Uncharacterized protein n=1 Tax=Parasponia andersonii TaxID=3476 RepID=A0A2P5CXZ5_PARAD|nr:hypothetical protein PanWU01x14_114090 [Parasponia andersonii]